MFDTDAIRAQFSDAARVYDQAALVQRRIRTQALEDVTPYWPDGSRILDIGCGTGEGMTDTPWQVYGVDAAMGMCKAAQERGLRAACADALALPFADGSFDGVFSSLMLQWIARPMGALREMARVLRPGGCALLTTLVDGTLKELRAAFAAVDGAPHVSDFVPAGSLPPLLAHAGFILLEIRDETLVEYYPDALAVMRSLKAIGASNKMQQRRRGLTTPRQMAAVRDAYEKASRHKKKGLPASWQVATFLLTKN